LDPFTSAAVELVATHGPWILFVMAIAETCFVTGLVVPSGVATSVATVLALEGHGSLTVVLIAAVSGGAVGDSAGFWIGRWAVGPLNRGEGWAGRRYRRYAPATARFFGGRPLYSVTVARLVSFVRTLMPMAAGMSPLRYPVFLLFEVPGVLLWAAMYAGIGLVARESWARVTSIVGAGWTVVFVVLGVAFWFRARRSRTGHDEMARGNTREETC
jgi:membrane protein DedA with SNARE-associated domain